MILFFPSFLFFLLYAPKLTHSLTQSLNHSSTHSFIHSLTCSPRGEKRKKLYRMYDQHDTAEGKGESGENVVIRLSF